MLPSSGRLVVIDPKREIDLPGLPVYTSDTAVFIKQPERFVFRPPRDRYNAIKTYEKLFNWILDRGDTFVYIDDVGGIFTHSRYPLAMKACYDLGRSKGIAILACIQRPASIPQFMVGSCRRFYYFVVTRHSDQLTMRDTVPEYNPSRLSERSHEFYYKRLGGEAARIMRIGS